MSLTRATAAAAPTTPGVKRPPPLAGRDLALSVAAELAARPRRRPRPIPSRPFDARETPARRRVSAALTELLEGSRRGHVGPGVGAVEVWAVALACLRGVGEVGLPPAEIREAMGAQRGQYAAVLPRYRQDGRVA